MATASSIFEGNEDVGAISPPTSTTDGAVIATFGDIGSSATSQAFLRRAKKSPERQGLTHHRAARHSFLQVSSARIHDSSFSVQRSELDSFVDDIITAPQRAPQHNQSQSFSEREAEADLKTKKKSTVDNSLRDDSVRTIARVDCALEARLAQTGITWNRFTSSVLGEALTNATSGGGAIGGQRKQSTPVITQQNANERTISAEDLPRSDMGYANAIHKSYQSRSPEEASSEMEGTETLQSEPKEQNEEAGNSNSVDSIVRGVLGDSDSAQSPGSPQGARPTAGGDSFLSHTFGTPSTISTEPSTDEASVDGIDSGSFDRATWQLDDAFQSSALLPRNPIIQSIPARESVARMPTLEQAGRSAEQSARHRRTRSWESQQRGLQESRGAGWEGATGTQYGVAHGMHQRNRAGGWEQGVTPQSRVASFRTDAPGAPGTHPYPHGAPSRPDSWRQGPRMGETQAPHGHQPHPAYQQANYGPYHGQPSPGFAPGTHTPPRSKHPRSPLHTPTHSHSPSGPSTPTGPISGSNPPRSSSEILKTLLRKKACLYEPDTSRAIAYVTWLVGRELALEYGYFSRQQLQSGVHACVTNKIDAGTITRTKVNRCMQIILNSCFHYIIPRPDGTEESGATFKESFALNSVDDSAELQSLAPPWDNLVVEKEFVLAAASRESSPVSSPRLDGLPSNMMSDDGQAKRSVLLCFNENVRSVADVHRCHNEFIRDTASAANLQLSAQEWRAFFGKDTTTTIAAWGGTGMPVAVARAEGDVMKRPDVLGRMSADELSRFRTTWCGKRYEHDHDLCSFAHVEVNGGWLRRNPLTQQYRAEMCPSIVGVADTRISPYPFSVNHCEKGEECDFAHSNEEAAYHPDRYKRNVCSSSARGGTCPLGDACPNFHTADTVAQGKRRTSPERRHVSSQRSSAYRHSYSFGAQVGIKAATSLPPEGSPMLYLSPAPVSSFEKQLGPPGLQSLFRRHSAVVCGYLRPGEKCKCCYTNFGDDWGIGVIGSNDVKRHRGLPSRNHE